MKVNIKGHVYDATVITENGQSVGHLEASLILDAYGIPYERQANGSLMVHLRAFADALGQPSSYVAGENTYYIASKPLPPLPADPVGAGIQPWCPVTAPICGGPGDRRPDLLTRIIQQFRVATNPRHAPRGGNTYCNIFLWDVTRALGAEIPHWVQGPGIPSGVGQGRELDANGVVLWLRQYGRDNGWRSTDDAGALAAANQGRPAVVVWYNPGGIGHVAIVRPGQPDRVKGLPIAQAGARNFDDGYMLDGFGRAAGAVEYYTHD